MLGNNILIWEKVKILKLLNKANKMYHTESNDRIKF